MAARSKPVESTLVRNRRARDREVLRVDYAERVRCDARVKQVFSKLRKSGVSSKDIRQLRYLLCAIPRIWYAEVWETASDRKSRRKLLGERLQEAVDLVTNDRELAHFTLDDVRQGHSGKRLVTKQIEHGDSLRDGLRWLVASLNRGELPGSRFPEPLARRTTLERFAVRQVFAVLTTFYERKRPIKMAVDLVGALLDRTIPTNRFARDNQMDLLSHKKVYVKE